MSASPQAAQSTKRPLEETSSPSRTDQPEAKRPALDKIIKGDEESAEPSADTKDEVSTAAETLTLPEAPAKTNGQHSASNGSEPAAAVPAAVAETKPAASTASSNAAQPPTNQNTTTHDETAWIHIRAVISSPEAATIIGKGGENVSKIRSMSGAKCTVSDYQKGAVERILTVSGIVDAVAKVSLHFFTSNCRFLF
jgi:heterogeneous nuclear rnp K-like protein